MCLLRWDGTRGVPATMQLSLRTIALPLKHVFRTSQWRGGRAAEFAGGTAGGGVLRVRRRGLVVLLRRDARDDVARCSRRCEDGIESERLDDPAALWDRLPPSLMHNRFALAALDEAAHDLWGKKLGQPVYKLWGLDVETPGGQSPGTTQRGQSHFRKAKIGTVPGKAKIRTVPGKAKIGTVPGEGRKSGQPP